MTDKIIDISDYKGRLGDEPPGGFSVWGGEGDRARFALPVWRAVLLLGGDRGGLIHISEGKAEKADPFFILDLGTDPARTEFSHPLPAFPGSKEAPELTVLQDGSVVVFLGAEKGKKWFLVVTGGREGGLPEGRQREDLLFLAGECAGLLFLRGFAKLCGSEGRTEDVAD